MDNRDRLIMALINAVKAAHNDAAYWIYEASAKEPKHLECNDEVEAVLSKAKEMGY